MKYTLIFLSLVLFSLTSCKDKEDTSVSTKISFDFVHKVGDQNLELNEMIYLNKAGNNYSVITLKYFISQIRLHNKTTNETVTFDVTHYVDAADKTTHSFVPEVEVVNGDYDAISFVFGLNETDNIDGKFPNPPQNAMEWPPAMGSGYHYMKLEGKYMNDSTQTNYNTHTGASRGVPYFVEVSLPTSFNLSGKETKAEIIMDVNKWYEDPNMYDFSSYGEMIMGNANAQAVIKANGANVFSVGSIK